MDSTPTPKPKPKPRPEPVTYTCGECGRENRLNLQPGVAIRCAKCGNGVVYKKRIRKIVQFQAR